MPLFSKLINIPEGKKFNFWKYESHKILMDSSTIDNWKVSISRRNTRWRALSRVKSFRSALDRNFEMKILVGRERGKFLIWRIEDLKRELLFSSCRVENEKKISNILLIHDMFLKNSLLFAPLTPVYPLFRFYFFIPFFVRATLFPFLVCRKEKPD